MRLNRKLALSALALVIALVVGGCFMATDTSSRAQGWTAKERNSWYWATQGSRLMPVSWFDALERATGTDPFSDPDYLGTFGFLQPPAGSEIARPIGFAEDRQDDRKFKVTGLRWYDGQEGGKKTAEKWIGLTCAACHTAQISYQGTTSTIDGGPNLLDFQRFVEALDEALIATQSDAGKWNGFAAKVLDGKDTPDNRQALQTAFATLVAWQIKTDNMNETPMRYGFGRLDAVGHILNKILMFTGAEVTDGNPANAPVSYPFLWNIWRQEHVQWNGVASNSRFQFPGDSLEYGALGRNTGEVLGVFGEVVVTPNTGVGSALKGYESSLRTENMDGLEHTLQRLEAPKWPEHFPPINQELADTGKVLFDQKCASCHKPPIPEKKGEPTEVMVTFQKTDAADLTDIWMACNAYVYDGPTGPMNGTKDQNGEVMGDEAPVVNMLATAAKGAILGDKKSLVKVAFRNFFGIRRLPVVDLAPGLDPRDVDRANCLETERVPILAYKARPLDGIWATAPYLHNGSVSSLYELVLPASQRKKSFWVGNREYDPADVGYVTSKPADGSGFELKTRTGGGGVIEGNSNKGHEYGARNFSEPERRALVEYMKTL